MPTGLTCTTCTRPLELRWRPAELEVARIRLVADRLPLLACPDGHEERGVMADYGQAATAQAEEQLTVARRPVLPWRPQRCGSCGTDLTMPGFRSERPVTVQLGDVPAHTLRLDVPLLRCTECAVENLPREAWDDVAQAIAAATPGGAA